MKWLSLLLSYLSPYQGTPYENIKKAGEKILKEIHG